MVDSRELGRGLYPGASNWREILEANQRQLTEAWTERADFKERYGGLNPGEYLAALYSNAGITPTEHERAELSAALASGRATRHSVLRRVSSDRKLFARDYDEAYVRLHYFGYLKRDPQDDFWLRDLKRTRDYRSLTRAFLESEEYKQRAP